MEVTKCHFPRMVLILPMVREETRGRDEVVTPERKKVTVTGCENLADDKKNYVQN